MKQLIQALTIIIVINFVLSCNTKKDKEDIVSNPLLSNCCKAINNDNNCSDDDLKRFEERINLGDYQLEYLYFKYNRPIKFNKFCERLNLSNIAMLKFGTWKWVKEESPYGTIIPSDRGYSETRLFESNVQERTLNDSSPEKSRFTLIEDLIKSTDSGGYETVERILKLTVDTLVIRIDKFQNTKTYINEQLSLNNLDYSKNNTNPNRRYFDLYHRIASSITYSKPPNNVKSIEELTNINGVSLSTTSGRIYSDGLPFSGYAYESIDTKLDSYKNGCNGCRIKIFKVNDGYKNGFQMIFRYNKPYKLPENIEIYQSCFFYNGLLTGRINLYSPIETQPFRITSSAFYTYGVKISCEGSNCDEL